MGGESPIAIGPEPSEAAAVAILVHGRGRSPGEMRDLALALAVPAVRFILPAAPGGTWYPESFLAPIGRNEPALTRSLEVYALAIDELIDLGVPPENIVLGGFSQGACLTAEAVIRHPRPYGGVAILTGGLIGPPGTAWPVQPALAGVPVYLTGSRIDEWVPVSRVEETATVFRRSGAVVTSQIFDARTHVVSEEEIAALRQMLQRLIAAKPSAPAVRAGRPGMIH
jgi:predicted esterase